MADGKGKAVMENEMSHSGDEDNQNLSILQSKTTKLQKRRKVKEGDVSVSNKKKKKSKTTTLTTDGWEGVEEVLIALKSPNEVRPRQAPSSRIQSHKSATPLPPALEVPKAADGDGVNLASNSVHPSGSNSATPLPVTADAHVGSATRIPNFSEMLGNDLSLQPKKQQCPPAAVVTVDVEGYKVKPELAATAQYILNKYGDVVAITSFKGSLLTHLLENLCQIYQKLEKSDFTDLTLQELHAMHTDLSDFQATNMNVGWLVSRLDDIINAKKVLHQDTWSQDQIVIVELENELRIKQESMQELQLRIEEIKEKLRTEKTKWETHNQIIMEAKEKVKRFHKKSLVDGI